MLTADTPVKHFDTQNGGSIKKPKDSAHKIDRSKGSRLALDLSETKQNPIPMNLFSQIQTVNRVAIRLIAAVVILSTVTATVAPPCFALPPEVQVLPQSRSKMSVIYGSTAGITNLFNENGDSEPIAAPFNLSLNSESFRKLDSRVGDLVNWLNNNSSYRYDETQRETSNRGVVLSDNSQLPLLGDALSRGNLGVEVEAHRSQYYLMYGRGLSEKISLAVVLPMIKQTVDIRHSLTGNNTARDIYDGFAASNVGAMTELVDTLKLLSSINTEDFQKLLESKGYSRISNRNESAPGDLQIGTRFGYFPKRKIEAGFFSGDVGAAFQNTVTIPTGKLQPTSELTGIDFGQGAWDTTLSHATHYSPRRSFTLLHGIQYTYRLPSSRLKRVRSHAGDFIPDASSEENLTMNLGDKFATTLGARYRFNEVVSLDYSYEWAFKGKDVYTGSRSDSDYSYLSDGTDQRTEILTVMATFSTVPLFLSGRFAAPGDFILSWNQPIRGKNSMIAPFGTAELALYF